MIVIECIISTQENNPVKTRQDRYIVIVECTYTLTVHPVSKKKFALLMVSTFQNQYTNFLADLGFENVAIW